MMVTEYDGSSLAKVFTPNSNNYREREYTGFNIYRALTSGGAYELIDNVGAATFSYEDEGLTNGVTYYYVVTACLLYTSPSPRDQA